jgi:hypothetical protein
LRNQIAQIIAKWCVANGEEFFPNPLADKIMALLESKARIEYVALRRPVDREALAEYAHKAWSGWMAYLFEKSALNQDGTVTIPLWAVERWLRQMSTEYKDLTDIEKSTDIYEADAIMDLIGRNTMSDKRMIDADELKSKLWGWGSGSDLNWIKKDKVLELIDFLAQPVEPVRDMTPEEAAKK